MATRPADDSSEPYAPSKRVEKILDALHDVVIRYPDPKNAIFLLMDAFQVLIQKPVAYTICRRDDAAPCRATFTTFRDLELNRELKTKFENMKTLGTCFKIPKLEGILLCAHKISPPRGSDGPPRFTRLVRVDRERISKLLKALGQAQTDSARVVLEVLKEASRRDSAWLTGDTVAPSQISGQEDEKESGQITAEEEDEEELGKYVKLMRTIVTQTWAEFSANHMLSVDKEEPLNLFCVIRRATNSTRRYGTFDYTAQLVLADDQCERINTKFPDASTNLLSNVEIPLSPTSRSIADSVFSSGTAEFISEKLGTGGRDRGSDDKDRQRREAENRVFDPEKFGRHIFYVPVHVGGVPWAALFTLSRDDREEEISPKVWEHNYHFYRNIAPQVCERLRLKAKNVYRSELARKFAKHFQFQPYDLAEDNIVEQVLKDWEKLTTYFPYGIVRTKKVDADTDRSVKLPSGKIVELFAEENPNKCFKDPLKLDLFGNLDLALLAKELAPAVQRRVNALRLRRFAVRTAAVAVMSRNMSHNIGSHVLAGVVGEQIDGFNPDPNAKDEKCLSPGGYRHTWSKALRSRHDLLRYIQERMDFLAEVSTATSYMSIPMEFRNVLDVFRKQSSIKAHITGIKKGNKGVMASVYCPEENSKILIGMPGGRNGCHALCTIFENVVRNSAKNGAGPDVKSVQLTVRVDPFNSHWRRVRMWDKFNNGRKPVKITVDGRQLTPELHVWINRVIKEPIIGEDGKIVEKNWGIREVMIAASYLRGFELEDLQSKEISPPLVQAVVVDDNGKNIEGEQAGNLGYEFFVSLPKIVLVVGSAVDGEVDAAKLREEGVDIVAKIADVFGGRAEHQYLVGNDGGGEEIDLPVRRIPLESETTKENGSEGGMTIQACLTEGKGFKLWHLAAEEWKNRILSRHGAEEAKLYRLGINEATCCGSGEPIPDYAKAVIYDHHGVLLGTAPNDLRTALFWEHYVQSYDQRLTFESPPKEAKEALAAEFLAAGVARIVVLDERVQNDIANHLVLSKDDNNLSMVEQVRRRRIYVPPPEQCDLRSKRKPERQSIVDYLRLEAGTTGFDFIVIHQGVLDRLASSGEEQTPVEWIGALAKHYNAELVICSGRGVPSEVFEESVRFVPLSPVLRWVVHVPSKFHLYQLLCASRRPRRD